MFQLQKAIQLHLKDRSKKGSIDAEIKEIVDAVNAKPEYYTTSSCAGRIIMLVRKTEQKKDTPWLLVSHASITVQDVMKIALPEYPVWLKQEGFILHVACRDMAAAERLLNAARLCVKRAGIISASKRIVVEIASTEFLETIIADKKRWLVSRQYLARLADEANRRMERNRKRLTLFLSEVQKL
ncbi:hypothetical protein HY491_04215 [Candidatus Woesearchaeota archaeon]|nr:hypothetical protein [Candidatus Woesearchaeota archaeon]